MSAVALALVLIAAIVHPTWNLIARRATHGDPLAFIWLTSAVSAALYVPVVLALVLFTSARLTDVRLDIMMMVGTGLLHLIYFVLLQRSYRVSDFSLVYPLARGTGPLVTALAAVAFFSERLAPMQCAGLAVIVLAIFIIAGGQPSEAACADGPSRLQKSLAYGIATGLAIAAYTLWDKRAVAAFAISPIIYDFGRTSFQALLFAPAVMTSPAKRTALAATWTQFGREVFGVAILSPLAYVLVLYALTAAPVSIVAPIRESSIIIGAFMGARLLNEGHVRRRVIAAAFMLAGIVALARG